MIEASVLARLLRIRLLRLEARIALVPASLAEAVDYPPPPVYEPPALPYSPSPPLRGDSYGDLQDAADLLAHASHTLQDARHA